MEVEEIMGKNLNFGQAIEALKNGKRVSRAGWNGKGMFLFLLPAGTVPTKAIHDPALRQVIEEEVGGDTFEALGSIRMWTADKKVLTGWLASQTDMLSEDWEVIGEDNSSVISGEWAQYKRKGLSEMRPYVKGEDLSAISVSKEDDPETDMGMIARNPKNHADQWYVARKYFNENLESA